MKNEDQQKNTQKKHNTETKRMNNADSTRGEPRCSRGVRSSYFL